jgi:hypothetical protein
MTAPPLAPGGAVKRPLERARQAMKTIHWVLLVVALAGAAGALYWFVLRKQPAKGLPPGSPYYTPPTAPPVGPVTRAAAPAVPRQQSLTATLQATGAQVAQRAAQKGLTLVADKATTLLSGLFDSWGSQELARD